MASILFLSRLVLHFVKVGLEKVSMNLDLENFVKIVSLSCSLFVFGTQEDLTLFANSDFSLG